MINPLNNVVYLHWCLMEKNVCALHGMHLRRNFRSERGKESTKVEVESEIPERKKRAVTRSGGFSGPMFLSTFSLFPCVELTLTLVTDL
jgi:hypothetical protein